MCVSSNSVLLYKLVVVHSHLSPEKHHTQVQYYERADRCDRDMGLFQQPLHLFLNN